MFRNRKVSSFAPGQAALLVAMAGLFAFAVALGIGGGRVAAASSQVGENGAGGFRVGERLSYSVSFERFPNVAYAEFYVASRGRLSDRDAVELRAKFKTLNLVSAAFVMLDESRTTFAAADTGLPLYTSRTQNVAGLPQESSVNYLTAPTPNFDLLTLVYKIRAAAGTGVVNVVENERIYSVTFQNGLSERIKTDAGEFDTVVVTLQSELFNDLGLKDVRLNLSTDEARLPVLIRFNANRGEFRARLASVQIIDAQPDEEPTPVAVPSPRPTATPRPVATPTPYIANLPLAAELAFPLGEALDYRISSGGRPVGTMTLSARERTLFNNVDSVLLAASITSVEPGPSLFAAGDYINARVDADTLAPLQIDARLSGALSPYGGQVKFEQQGSVITFDGNRRVDGAPIGTHSVLSLLYALRSFNLKPSRDRSNPVNDTRVAVFWRTEPAIFTLRPSPETEAIMLDGQSVPAQLVSVTTRVPELDRLDVKIWLSNTERRLPMRFVLGGYQADLIAVRNTLSR